MTEQMAIVYDRQKFFFLKQLLNSYLNANPVLKPAQLQLDTLMKGIVEWQGKAVTLQHLMMQTNDPAVITMLGMNMDILRLDKPMSAIVGH